MVKKTILIMAVFMVLAGTANGEELKMKVPVDKWRKLRTRLYSLEKENNSLKQKVRALEAAGKKGSGDRTARIDALEAENNRLRQEVRMMESAAGSRRVDDETKGRLADLEDENNRLRQEVKALEKAAAKGSGNGKYKARVAALKKQNLRLKKKIQALRSGVVAVSYTGEKRSARHEFFRARHKATTHVFTD